MEKSVSGFAGESLAAFGAADIQLATLSGHSHRLLTVGTVEIAIFPIPQTGQEGLPLA